MILSKKLTGNGVFESSRMMLPEHIKAYVQYKHGLEMEHYMVKNKAKRPPRDELELEELGNQLTEAKQEETIVTLFICGEPEMVTGRIAELDARTKLVHVQRNGELTKVPFLDIIKVEYPRA